MKYLFALVVLLAVQFTPGLPVISVAQAQEFGCNTNSTGPSLPTCLSREQAYNECMIAANAYEGELVSCGTYGAPNGYQCYGTSFRPCSPALYRYFPFPGTNGGCPAGETWNEDSKTCHSAQKCLAKEPLPASYTDTIVSVACSAGCEFAPASGNIVSVQVGNGAPTTALSGWVPTGNACSAGDVAPTPMSDEQVCFDPGDGQTFCMKADGRQCYKAVRNGRQICWRPGEVGEKADGPVLQKRNAGATPLPPTTPPPPGDAFQQSGTPQVAQTTSGGSVFNTTTTNYQTSGIDAVPGGSDDGEPADGSGSGEGEGEGEGGGVSGGGDCSSPPVIKPGTGELEAYFISSVWLERCEGMSGLSADIDAAVADGEAAVNETENALQNYINNPFGFSDDAELSRQASEVAGPETTSTDMLDSTGFLGASTCPTFPAITVGSTEITLAFDPLCEMLANFGWLVLTFAYFVAARIIAIS